MADFNELARAVLAYAAKNYAQKGARFDVLVECYEPAEVAAELEQAGVSDEAAALRWADKAAGLHHEQELNQAWDGPESCVGSELYDPARAPAGPPEDPSDGPPPIYDAVCDDGGLSLEERFEHYAFEERNGMPYGSSF